VLALVDFLSRFLSLLHGTVTALTRSGFQSTAAHARGHPGEHLFWSRLAQRDDRLLAVYVAALIGAFLGAKIVYFFAEGYQHLGASDLCCNWRPAKRSSADCSAATQRGNGQTTRRLRGVTGDWFATIARSASFSDARLLVSRLLRGQSLSAAWFTVADATGVALAVCAVEILFNVAMVGVSSCFAARNCRQHFTFI